MMAVSVRRYERLPCAHIHLFDQIVLPLTGIMEMEIGKRVGRIDFGNAALIGAGQRHVFDASEADRFVVIDLDDCRNLLTRRAGLRGDLAPALGPFFSTTPAIKHLIGYVWERCVASSSQAISDIRLPDSFARPWTALLIGTMFDQLGMPLDPASQALERAFRFMRANLAKRITTADVAAAAGLSERRLCALFRLRINSTPYAEIIALRLNYARALLCTTSLPVAEIAVMSGHTDQSGLTRRMRAVLNVTPSALRRAAMI